MSDDRRWFDSDIGSAVALFGVGLALVSWIAASAPSCQSCKRKHAAPVEAPKEPR